MIENTNLLECFERAYPRDQTPIIVTEVIVCAHCGTEAFKNLGYQQPENFYAFEFSKPKADGGITIQYSWGCACDNCKNWLEYPQAKRGRV